MRATLWPPIDVRGIDIVAGMPVVRILHFSPRRVDFDGHLRAHFIPILRSQAGLLDLVAGRHGPDERGPRIVVSVWTPDAMVAIPPWSEQGLLDTGAPLNDPEPGRQMEVMPVRVHIGGSPEVAKVLRVFRGRVRRGELDRYIEEAAKGARADVAAGRGPLGFYLAIDEATPDRFVTASTWSEWSVIEAATGGDIRRPVATRLPERLVESEATHYEVIDV